MPYGFSLSRSRLPVFLFITLDMVVSYGASVAAAWLRFGYFENSYAYQSLGLLHAFLVVGCSALTGVYQPWRGRPLINFLFSVLVSWGLSFTLLVAYLVMIKSTQLYSRIWLGSWIVGAVVLSLALRAAIYWGLRYFRRQGCNSKRVLVIGHGQNYEAIINEMKPGNDWGFRLDACLAYEQVTDISQMLKAQLARDDTFDECWLCLPLKDSGVIHEIMHELRFHTMDIRYMPGIRDMALLNHKVTPIGGFYSLDLSCSPMEDLNHLVKRAEDIILSLVILPVVAPVMLLVALAVKLTSSGPVLFRQERLGANGQKINIYKFRSMKLHSEVKGTVTQAIKYDHRLTAIGGFLRKTSLDELPQFFNVLSGSMSIVGPRPHALVHNEEYRELVDSYMKRHKVKPGITGLAQVNGFRGQTDTVDKMRKRVEMDLKYINSWSVLLDLKIIILTVFRGLTSPNAY